MVIDEGKFFFRVRHVYHDDLALEETTRLIKAGMVDYATALSFHRPEVPPQIKISEKTVVQVPLGGTPEEILARFHDTARNEVRRSFRSEALSFIGADTAHDQLYALYTFFERAQGRVPWGRARFDQVEYFAAYHRGSPVAAMAFYPAGAVFQVLAIFSYPAALPDMSWQETRRLLGIASRRLVYEACCFARGKGFSFLGLSSISNSDLKKKNISRFKTSFGGILAPEYTLVYKSFRFQLIAPLITLSVAFRRFFKL